MISKVPGESSVRFLILEQHMSQVGGCWIEPSWMHNLSVGLSHGHFLQRLCMFCPSEPIHGSYTITAGMVGRNPREF